MPRIPSRENTLRRFDRSPSYIGIDPGENGGLVEISGSGGVHRYLPMPDTERDLWNWIDLAIPQDSVAAIEQQLPRPTNFFDKSLGKWRASILKSTCVLYGNYMLIRGMLIAKGVSFREVVPGTWQKALSVSPKKKTESTPQWKNRLRGIAQQYYPGCGVWKEKKGVQLAVADALLIARYCREKENGNGT